MKKLFIISLKFPLINAINIMLNVMQNPAADIILIDNGTDMSSIANRLSKLSIFDNVFVANIENKRGGNNRIFQRRVYSS